MTDASVSDVLSKIKDIVVEVIDESTSPFGVPSGHIYAALMTTGLSLGAYQQLMSHLVREGRIRGPENHCYFSTKKVARG